ncbi:NUDIX domain-containing protein [Halosolutus amylolyticus]|uniref:NUDIX domain-containing protein n=1 Tax=Halosolutus amylolyticus TaxID=2932267 RepID=A0ABD5PSR3_9EURY|nr:NUDIX hydrolase [Halosolutus amylolyticus]
MTSNHSDTSTEGTAGEPIADLETLRHRDDVAFHEETDTADPEALDELAALDDLVVVGVTNEQGSVLLRRLTADCAWKLPLVDVQSGESYADAARRAVETVVGLEITLDAIAGVWRFELQLENGDRTETRHFVVFGATPANGTDVADLAAPDADEDGPVGVGWFDDLPDDAEEAPGTRLFFE